MIDSQTKKMAVNVAVTSLTGLQPLLDTWTTPHEQFGDTLCFPSVIFFFYTLVLDHNKLPSGGSLFLCENPERLCELENITTTSSDIGVDY